jgi:Flp pilus assembly CpaE family ATPase
MHRSPLLDERIFAACRTSVQDSNINFLSPSLDGDSGLRADLSQLAQCLKLIRDYAGFWIVDMPRHLDKHFVTLTDLCDKIIVVFEATVSGVAAAQRWLAVFRELGYDKERIICVVNRSGSKYKTVEEQLHDCFDGQIVFNLPNASSVIWECAALGVPVVSAYPGHVYSKAVNNLARAIGESGSKR